MSKTKFLAVSGVASPITATVPPEAYTVRDAALAKSKAIVEIKSKDDIEEAVARISVLKGLANGVEDMRKELTAPLLKGQRDIKAMADKFVTEPLAEVKRLEGLVSAFHQAEVARQEAERRRIEQEQNAARQAQAELEKAQRDKEAAARREEEARKQAAEAKKASDRKRLEQEAEVARQEKESLELKVDEIGFEMPVAPEVEVAPEVQVEIAGATVREGVLEIEVVDQKALIQFALDKDRLFDFFKLEPRIKNIKEFITFHVEEGKSIPGVKAEKRMKVSGRAANPLVALEG